MQSIRIGFVSQSRQPDPLRPELKSSPVWGDIREGVETEASKHSIISECIVLNDESVYSDINSVIDRYEQGSRLGVDVLIGPIAPQSGPAEEKLLNVLLSFAESGGKIVAVNSGPSEKIKNALGPSLLGFAGPDEEKMGMVIAEEVFSSLKARHVVVMEVVIPDDKPPHRGYRDREKSIIEVALRYGVRSIRILLINADNESTFSFTPEDGTLIFGLGPIGTIFALKTKKKYPDKIVGIGTMDMDQETRNAILSGDIFYSVLQNPREQGARAVQIAVNAFTSNTTPAYQNLHCKVRVADKNNANSIK